ncbi:DNA-3-methyladenine glycosylase 2 [Desulfomonile tiedjei]|uniref:DNA-3-methyladenine glycosylase II n=1 Tax=Desulfomonile tiedjei (strain ATCC 49306 / DSM 6799 / DCB-1) TaxID=706587 RepID=I4C4X3_DESTA|nr:DNA-3-methyladenine glycosylase 2 [Desulfomonile tiedjei]AFM24614.1 3-methyladenine DNA glycosylase/8-oxoguanine DNA glycosylase [Desulfomonile tiedjei DSM 6799]
MNLDTQICDRARLARDPRFDGLFFIGVLSTGIYCRPICPARSPKAENIVYFPSAAAAAEAGFRPCLRCRPEAAPGSPAWNGTSATVSRAVLLIRQGELQEQNMEDLASKLGVTGRHLRRLFQIHIGASPKTLATTQKILFAKKLLSETDLSVTHIAFASGFGSIRRFNAAFSKMYGRTPSSVRMRNNESKITGDELFRCTLTLSYRPPFDWQRMLEFFELRAIPGVEWVANGAYHRTIRINETTGMISVAPSPKGNALLLTVALSDSRDLMSIVERVRRMFDLDANMAAIHEVLTADAVLEKSVRKHPGLRLPGIWDPFEAAVRAVLGQQVSVKGARTLIGRIVAKTAPRFESPDFRNLTHFFPTAHELNTRDLGAIGMPESRVRSLQALAEEVDRENLFFVVKESLSDFIEKLTRIPGIGDWTAQYIAMRAMGEPDAFPAGDLGIVKAMRQADKRLTVKEIRQRAETWRPWRAYATMYLWHG